MLFFFAARVSVCNRMRVLDFALGVDGAMSAAAAAAVFFILAKFAKVQGKEEQANDSGND